MSDLAFVIPAYKETFFDKTLNSLAQQTNKNFTVYIGDDCSPFNLKSIVDKYRDQLTIYYTRFPNNIGAKELVSQWARCIELAQQEKWLCLFSDDDLLDNSCIEKFYQTVNDQKDAFDVYRFNTVTIDKHDTVITPSIIGPQIESSEQMAYHLLKGERGNSMPDHVFSREIYDKYGGFVFTDYAQGADWATSINFSQKKGICVIPDAKIYWRVSGTNISSIAADKKGSMIVGHLQFIAWALKHFEYLKPGTSSISYTMMVEALRNNLRNVLKYHYRGFNLKHVLPIFNLFHKKLGLSYYQSIKVLTEIRDPQFPIFNKAKALPGRVINKILRTVNLK